MTVYGEQNLELDIWQGCSGLPGGTQYYRKPGLCVDLFNMVKTSPTEYTIREDWVMLHQLAATYGSIAVTNAIPRRLSEQSVDCFYLNGISGTDTPSYLVCDGGSNTVKWLNYNASSIVATSQPISAVRLIKDIVQYKDRYYATNRSTTIFRVSGFSTGGGALTINDLVSINNVNLLLAFKNRIFAFTRNRIYWTDLATAGGYPETWNTSYNFTDLPSSAGDATIWSVKVFKDKIYIFTDRGIYIFAVNGDPANWNLQLLSSTFNVFNYDSVAINKSILYLTDQRAIYSFDGTRFVRISDNIQEVFYNSIYSYTNCVLFPFEDGIILNRQQFTNASGVYAQVTNRNDYWYWDGEIWSRQGGNSQGGHGDLFHGGGLLGARSGFIPYKTLLPSSVFTFESTIVGNINTFWVDSGKWRGDCPSTNWTGGTRYGKSCVITAPPPFLFERNYIKWKYFNVYGKFDGAGSASMIAGLAGPVNNSPYIIADPTQSKWVTTITDWNLYNSMMKIVASQDESAYMANYYSPSVLFYNVTSGKIQQQYEEPPIVINKIEVVYNNDTRQKTQFMQQ